MTAGNHGFPTGEGGIGATRRRRRNRSPTREILSVLFIVQRKPRGNAAIIHLHPIPVRKSAYSGPRPPLARERARNGPLRTVHWGPWEEDDMTADRKDLGLIAERLRLGTGFSAAERDGIAERLAALGSRLRSFSAHSRMPSASLSRPASGGRFFGTGPAGRAQRGPHRHDPPGGPREDPHRTAAQPRAAAHRGAAHVRGVTARRGRGWRRCPRCRRRPRGTAPPSAGCGRERSRAGR